MSAEMAAKSLPGGTFVSPDPVQPEAVRDPSLLSATMFISVAATAV